MTILVVDDSPEDLELLSRILEHKHQVLTASDGAEGLRLAKIHQPDLILLDVQMPDLDGYEVLQRLKADEALAKIPVIVMSAWYDGIESVTRGLELGAFDYLSKPIERIILFTRLHLVSRMKQSEERAQRQQAELRQLNAALKQEIANYKWAEEELHKQEKTLQALLNATTESAFLTDLAGTVLACNEVAAQRLGKRVGDLIGMDIYEYLPPDLAQVRVARTEEILRNGQSFRIQDERAGRIYDNNISPVFSETGNVIALAIFARDMTEIIQAEEAVQTAHAELTRQLAERTAELQAVKAQLQQEIEKHKLAEEVLNNTSV